MTKHYERRSYRTAEATVLLLSVWASTFVADIASKRYVQAVMNLEESVPIINNVFHITYRINSGAAFGLLPNRTTAFIVITIGITAIVLVYGLRERRFWARVALGMVLGGATGNLFDRVISGYVVDFLDFRIWPVFNVADAAIVAGGILFIWKAGLMRS